MAGKLMHLIIFFSLFGGGFCCCLQRRQTRGVCLRLKEISSNMIVNNIKNVVMKNHGQLLANSINVSDYSCL